MKNLVKILLPLLLVSTFAGCGGNGEKSSKSETQNRDVSSSNVDGGTVVGSSETKKQDPPQTNSAPKPSPTETRTKGEIADSGHYTCNAGDTCETGLVCVGVGGSATACASECQTGADCGAKNKDCVYLSRKSDQSLVKVCKPIAPMRTKGEIADSGHGDCLAGHLCEEGLTCVFSDPSQNTACAAECQSDDDCGAVNKYCAFTLEYGPGPTYKSVWICSPVKPTKGQIADSGHMDCLAGDTCEVGLVCVGVGSAKACSSECETNDDCGNVAKYCSSKAFTRLDGGPAVKVCSPHKF